MKPVIAWGNPHDHPAKGKHMAKKRRRRSRKASASTTPKKRRGNRRRKNPAGGKRRRGRARRRNPSVVASLGRGLGAFVAQGASYALGALAVRAIGQNVLPTTWRMGTVGALVKAGLGLALGYVASKVTVLRRFAEPLAVGGVLAAVEELVEPTVLPALQFNLLGEAYYLGELDSRRLIALRGGVGELDSRTLSQVAAQPAALSYAQLAAAGAA